MERVLSILALVVAIGIGAYAYVTIDRQRGEVAALNAKMETLTKTVADSQKSLTSLTAELAPLLEMIRQQSEPQQPKFDMAKLTPEANAKFLADYEKQPGVKKTASGLLYKVTKEGAAGGKQPTVQSTVNVNYHVAFIDGEVLDASDMHGGAQSLPLPRMIPAWQEAIPLMKEGDSWELVVPAALGYGEGGDPPAGQVLIFKIDLLKVES